MTDSATPPASMPEEAVAAPAVGWRWALASLALTWVALLFLFRDTAWAMATIWYRSETFNHCFLVFPIAGWLVWRQRQQLLGIAPVPMPWLLVVVTGLALLWLMGDLVAVNAVTQAIFVALLVVSVPAILGWRVARSITFPLVFLFFSVPVGEFLMPRLMESTADFTVWALRLSGVPVLREGLQFVIPTGNWSVVEACSGVRYLIASLTVGTLFAYLNYQSTRRRLLFVLVSILVPVVANWLRAYMIVMLGHLSGNTLAVGVDHLIYGWVFFGIVILLMFMVGARWSEPEPSLTAARSPQPASAASARRGAFLFVASLVVVVSALPQAAKWGLRHTQLTGPVALQAPETLAAGWLRDPTHSVDFKPSFVHASAEINQAYRADGGAPVGLYLGYYRNQDYERKLVSSQNVLVGSKNPEWSRTRSGTRMVDLGTTSRAVRTLELRHVGVSLGSGGERLVAWQLYWIDGVPTASDYLAKLHGALKRLMGRGDESAVLVVYAEQSATADADALLARFLRANYESIDGLLSRVRTAP